MSLLSDYEASSFHQWWVVNVWKPTWTKFTTAIYGIPAVLVTAGQQASKFANDDTITSYMAQMNVPNWVPMGLAGIALLHYVASGHKD